MNRHPALIAASLALLCLAAPARALLFTPNTATSFPFDGRVYRIPLYADDVTVGLTSSGPVLLGDGTQTTRWDGGYISFTEFSTFVRMEVSLSGPNGDYASVAPFVWKIPVSTAGSGMVPGSIWDGPFHSWSAQTTSDGGLEITYFDQPVRTPDGGSPLVMFSVALLCLGVIHRRRTFALTAPTAYPR